MRTSLPPHLTSPPSGGEESELWEVKGKMLEILLSQTVSGLVLGGLYVLIAIGLSIIFGLLGIVNFAHGAFFTLGAYFALTLVEMFGWPAVILSPIIVGGIGMVAERLLIRRLYDKEPLISLIVTFALALLIEATVRLIYGGIGQPFSPPPFMAGFLIWGPILITKYRVGVLLTTATVLLLLWLFLEKTPFGRILRAGSRDPEMVGLLGINLPKVLTWVFGLGCAISGIAGMLAAPLWTVTPAMATNAIMPAFVVVAIGGLGSFAGAVIAGLLVGVVVALTIQFWPEASGAVMYLFMALMLLLRPRGLLGERWERFE
jgi:branched-chain amino acid transport system permease protein